VEGVLPERGEKRGFSGFEGGGGSDISAQVRHRLFVLGLDLKIKHWLLGGGVSGDLFGLG